jgi:tRNA uridine 5-carboxymethylaminomethyl modification enzyme
MFTSRAEYRTLLRQDNADIRLTPKSFALGLASQERMDNVSTKEMQIEQVKELLQSHPLEPGEVNEYLETKNSAGLVARQRLGQLLLRPNIELSELIKAVPSVSDLLQHYGTYVLEEAEIQVKYNTYIIKEQELVDKMQKLEELEIPESFNYDKLNSLSNEARQKFARIQPRTLGQASRISGVNPSDVQILMVYMGR